MRDISPPTVLSFVASLADRAGRGGEVRADCGRGHRPGPGPGVPGRRHHHAALVLCRARRAVEPQARHHQVQRPTGLPARRRRHLHLRPAAGMHPRCERHFATTPVAEIVAHSGDGFVDKGAKASATAKRLIVCCDGTWNTLNQAVCGDPCPTNVSQMAGRSRISTGRNATTLLLRGGRRRPVGATQGRPGHRRGAQLVRVHPVDQRPTGRPAGRTGVVRRRAQRRRR